MSSPGANPYGRFGTDPPRTSAATPKRFSSIATVRLGRFAAAGSCGECCSEQTFLGSLSPFLLRHSSIAAFRRHRTARSRHELPFFFGVLPFWVVLAKLYGLYERDEEKADHSTVDDFLGVFHLVTVGVWLFYLGSAATGIASPPLSRMVLLWAFAIACVTAGRAFARSLCRGTISYLQNTIIVGAGDVGQLIAKKILAHPEYGLNVVGFVDARPKTRAEGLDHHVLLGPTERLSELIQLLDVERVIVAFSNESEEETLSLIRSIKDFDVQVDIVPSLFEVVGSNVSMHAVEGMALVGLPPLRLSRSSRLMKSAVDVVLAAIGLLILTPFFLPS